MDFNTPTTNMNIDVFLIVSYDKKWM